MSKRAYSDNSYIVETSVGADVTGDVIDMSIADRIALQIVWTGTLTGDFLIEASNDGTTWIDLGISPSVSAAGSAGSAMMDLDAIGPKMLRLFYDHTSGSGDITVKTHKREL